MDDLIIYLVAGGIALVLILGAVFFLFSGESDREGNESLRNLIDSQRKEGQNFTSSRKKVDKGKAALLASTQGNSSQRKASVTSPGLTRRLYYARWSITAVQFRIIQAALTTIVVAGVYPFLRGPLIFVAFCLTPMFIDFLLERAIKKRYEDFDRDYPDFLMSFTSRLKSGMNAMTALESAASGFDEGSALRGEVSAMLERVRLGIEEEKAIGTFGETIPHPEIELFVQGLILSRRLGGNLSQTIERLAKQVRKRQEFRKKAVGAVALERGSGIMVGAVMTATLIFIGIAAPDLLIGAFEDETGQLMFQGAASISIFGFYVSKLITNIKV
jgi:tight adherence protein B